MNKLSYILISGIALLVVVIIGTLFLSQKTTTEVIPTPVYSDFAILLPNTEGVSIKVENFISNGLASTDSQNPDLYTLGNTFPADPTIDPLPPYVITYESKTGYFNVTLLKLPLASAQQEAQDYLKSVLKVNETTLCSLSYMVSVPGYVSEDASSIDYRFSFCPDAIKL